MLNRKKLAWICAVALVVTTVALVFAAGVAHGSDEPAVRGQACIKVGEHRFNRSGTEYVCEQRRGDLCPVWHAAHPRRGPWPKPSPCVCPSKSASPSPTVGHTTSTTSKAPVPGGSATPTPVAAQLPVTGLPTVVVGAAAVGVLLILAGAALFVLSLRRIPANPKE